MAHKTSDTEMLGKKHGKYDMDRVGLFSEMPYLNGPQYKQSNKSSLNNVGETKTLFMNPGTPKTKSGLQDAYFDRTFKRLFENEKWRPQPGLFNTKERRGGKTRENVAPFLLSGSTKRHSTPGDYFGTFGPKLPAMSAVTKPVPKIHKKLLPNIVTAPTNTRGPGYADIGLNPFPEYKSSPYYTSVKRSENGKNKSAPFVLGGINEYFEKNPHFNKDIKPTYRITYKDKFKGTPFLPPSTTKHFGNGFDKWPKHLDDRYVDPYRIGNEDKKRGKKDQSKIFYPQTRDVSMYTTSTIQRKLKIAMNNNNWRTFNTVSFPTNENKIS